MGFFVSMSVSWDDIRSFITYTDFLTPICGPRGLEGHDNKQRKGFMLILKTPEDFPKVLQDIVNIAKNQGKVLGWNIFYRIYPNFGEIRVTFVLDKDMIGIKRN